MWFDNWFDILRVLIVGTAAYVTLVLVIRASGKRSLSQLNAFDLIVTVALGSSLATILLSADVSYAEGLAALALLAALQFVVTFLSSRWRRVHRVVTAEPTLILRNGRLDHQAMRRVRLSEAEVLQAIRQTGQGDLSQIAAVVLETNGKFSVITTNNFGTGNALGAMTSQTAEDREGR